MHRTGPALFAALLTGLMAAGTAPAIAGGSCAPAPVACDVRSLRPLQGALGWGEVNEKTEKISRHHRAEIEDLACDPIKVVRGPGGALFITDHHHGAAAWLKASPAEALCQVVEGPRFATEAEFWKGLTEMNLMWPHDEAGRPLTPDQLPTTVDRMPDDPFRTLAWRLRKKDGFCRTVAGHKEFIEFAWADWMRGRPELAGANLDDDALARLVKLARSEAARGLPGWTGDRPGSFTCPKDD